MKKTYTPPVLKVVGTVEQMTHGSGWGIRDFFVFGISDPIHGHGHAHGHEHQLAVMSS